MPMTGFVVIDLLADVSIFFSSAPGGRRKGGGVRGDRGG